MREFPLFTPELIQELHNEKPNYLKIKNEIIKIYNREHEKSLSLTEGICLEDAIAIEKWLLKLFHSHPQAAQLFYQRKQIQIPFISPNLAVAIGGISNFDCPFCTGTYSYPIQHIPIRIAALSKQASPTKLLDAFKKAIKHRLSMSNAVTKYEKGDKLCVYVVFVLSRKNKNKDLDNMSKALMDALEDILFDEDMEIQHLNLMKIRSPETDAYLNINIRKSLLHQHDGVIFKDSMRQGWAGWEFLALENFME